MTGIRINGISIKTQNTKSVTFNQEYFQRFTKVCSKAILGMGQYHPSMGDVSLLRSQLEELYSFIAIQLTDLYGGFEFDTRLMSGAMVEKIDLVEGLIEVSIKYRWEKNVARFSLKVCNEGAPYTTTISKIMREVGSISNYDFGKYLDTV